jgi:hypothetical protein
MSYVISRAQEDLQNGATADLRASERLQIAEETTITTSMKCVAIVLIGVLGSAATAFAQQPSPGATPQPAVPTAPATAPNAATTSATTAPGTGSQGEQTNSARPAPDIIKEARRDGYALKIKAKSGIYVFCKTDASVGSRFTKESCVDVDKFALMQQQKQRDQEYMRTTIEGLQCDSKMGC